MPAPLELILDPVSLAVFGLYLGMLMWEKLRPARVLPNVPYWELRGLLAFVVYFFASSYLPLWLEEPLSQLGLVDARSLGTLGGAALALFVYEGLVYVWHRTLHASSFLFRSVHQLHHSAERLDVSGSFWFSPLDMLGFTVLSTLTLTLIGFTPQAVTLFVLAATLLGVFQHANVRTPRWLGYLVQRPESHSRHHERGLHRGNYADLPLFDLLFGTFQNPAAFTRETGFYPGASDRVLEMLIFKNVSQPREHTACDVLASDRSSIPT